jgi:hypothetical protein
MILLAIAASLSADKAQAQIFGAIPAGVEIDAAGVLRMRTFPDPTGQLTRQRIMSANAVLGEDLARPSKMRMVSLNRLEAAMLAALHDQRSISDEMRFLAGLTRIDYVFVYPESNDIVIAGPAEGFMTDLSGRAVGISTGQAILELEDLVVALRAYPPGADAKPTTIGCSIDPTPEGLQRMRSYIASVSGHVTPADAERYAMGMRAALGLQEVTIRGVSPQSHFAQVLVEADYRMKLIGIGLEQPPVPITSYIQKASPSDVARNALQRWYFVPDYQAVQVSEDGLAMQLVGNGVKLIGENELVTHDGRRVQTKHVNRASQSFVRSFTQRYGELSKKVPVYGQLRNVINLAIVAAYLQQHDLYGRVDWDLELFRDESRLAIENYPVPRQVESAINVVWKGSTLMTPIGGGVHIQADEAFAASSLAVEENGEITSMRNQTVVPANDPLRWWWD